MACLFHAYQLLMNLQALYELSEHTRFLHSRFFVEGVITGACASPEIPLADTWLPWTLSGRPQNQQNAMSEAQTELIFEHLFGFFKATLVRMKDGQLLLPDYAKYRDKDSSAPLAEYCAGLMMAHQSCESLWAEAWQSMQAGQSPDPKKMAKKLKHCLLVFSTFANPHLAIEQASSRGEADLQQKLPKIAQSLQATLEQYVEISGELAAYLPNQFETFQQ